MRKNLNQNETKRYYELHQKAINIYLDKTEFDASQWLDDKEGNELQVLIDKEQGNN